VSIESLFGLAPNISTQVRRDVCGRLGVLVPEGHYPGDHILPGNSLHIRLRYLQKVYVEIANVDEPADFEEVLY